jgi:transglutaminase-like putative cysteine protease
MTLERSFRLSSCCLIASGFASAALAGDLHWFPVALFAAALVYTLTGRPPVRMAARVVNGILFAGILVFAAEYLILSHPFVMALAHLAFLAATIKLLTLSRDRDYLFLYLTSFTFLLATSTFTPGLLVGSLFLVFFFSSVPAFILYEMRCGSAAAQQGERLYIARPSSRHSPSDQGEPHLYPSRSLVIAAFAIALLILIIATPLFLLLPRNASFSQNRLLGETQLVSGFSDRVELGRGGTVRKSDTVVMRVVVRSTGIIRPADLKWRGLAFDHYDGRSWQRSDPVQYPVPIRGGYFKLEESVAGTDWLYQTYFLEALSTDVVFAAHKALAVSRDVGYLAEDSAENLYAGSNPQRKLRYEALSDLSHPDFKADLSATGSIPPEVARAYLQLPSLDPRIKDLAEEATGSADSPYEKAKALETYLRTRYTYSLELASAGKGIDPVTMFLFETREGHCEYFASAMAILLRYLGIPSRFVNGFQAGEYNRLAGDWIVRQYHAHSWTEAYFPRYGWIEFDPTPVQPPPGEKGMAGLWAHLSDAMDLWWWEQVVSYDATKQNILVRSVYSVSAKIREAAFSAIWNVFDRGRALASRMSGPDKALYRDALWVAPVLALLCLFLKPVRRRILRRTNRVLLRNSPERYATAFYREALEILSRGGIVKEPQQTPMEFAESISGHPAAAPLSLLTLRYNLVRFGPPTTQLDPKEPNELLQALRQSIKHR